MPIPEYWPVKSFTKDTVPVILISNESRAPMIMLTSYHLIHWSGMRGKEAGHRPAVCVGWGRASPPAPTKPSASQTWQGAEGDLVRGDIIIILRACSNPQGFYRLFHLIGIRAT